MAKQCVRLEVYVLVTYQDWYRLVTVRSIGDDSTVDTATLPALFPDILTHSHYPDKELTNPCPVLVLLSATQGNGNQQLCKSLGLTHLMIEPTIYHQGSEHPTYISIQFEFH